MTPAGTMTPNSGTPLPNQSQPSFQAGTSVGDVSPEARDTANDIGDAQALGMPSFTGMPNALPPAAPPTLPQLLAGGDVPLPPVRPPQALIDALAAGSSPSTPTPDSATTGSVDQTPTGSIAPDVPAPNAVPAMGQGIPPSAWAAALSPIGKQANETSPTAFNLQQAAGYDPQSMASLLGAPAGATPAPNTSAAPASVGPGSAFRNVMDGGNLQQTAAQRYAQLMSQPDQGSSQGSAPMSTQADGQRLAMAQLIADPRTPPEVTAMIMQRLMPPVMGPEKLGAGEALYGRRGDGSYGLIANNPAAPIAMNPGQHLMGRDGSDIGSVPAAPMKMGPGETLVQPGQGGAQPMYQTPAAPVVSSTKLPGGLDLPTVVNPSGPNGPTSQMMTPPAQPGQPNALGGLPALAGQAGDMAAQQKGKEAAATSLSDTLKKTSETGIEARRQMQQLDQLQALSNQFGSGAWPMLLEKANEWGIPTKTGSAVQSYEGLAGQFATGMRPEGSGALRVAEMDRFRQALGTPSMSPQDRLAAIGRYRSVLQRDAQMGDMAASGQANPQGTLDQIHQLAAQPYGDMALAGSGAPTAPAPAPASQPIRIQSADDYAKLPSGTQFYDPSGHLRTKR